MADDGGAKRLKPPEDGVAASAAVAELRGRVSELESENEELRRELARLRLGLQVAGGGREALPVFVPPATVDLSRVDAGVVAHISSFLGTSRELLDLGLTSKSFGWRHTASTLNWSLVEEVARQAVTSRATDGEICSLPRHVRGTTTWLSILHRFENLLAFDVLLGGYIEHRNGDRTTVCGTERRYSAAVSSRYVMRSGLHYAEFVVSRPWLRDRGPELGGIIGPELGIVRPMPGLNAGACSEELDFFERSLFPQLLSQRSEDWGDGDVHACQYGSFQGLMYWTNWDDDNWNWDDDDWDDDNWNWDDDDWDGEEWEGMEGYRLGDTIGMLLNLDEGTLAVYKNNRRLGVMKDGLSGSYCWCVTVTRLKAFTIKRGTPPDSEIL
ncbi:hypothetical protein THAOC_29753 [Thalassiosira oceanica]|uniref:B30.2/SPRY domain-containing protein n=1 Tax=Thalassiosira oceanica TaxID=159749 RepID=K0RD45_THAOC|nr:hypothetical protein THAOC_29753 [Thalassiosira oceanica]|eukprot:EJK51110.1 hypothetical protein THAOC_29753 [Thalassiosira oceanica]